ncbi:hypothetical protein YDYSY3_41030 [Paenibacillus chitinolyticus]|nr:hypothetical protein YDYSY3_41030 [Paenibacillus chitinolyticus]
MSGCPDPCAYEAWRLMRQPPATVLRIRRVAQGRRMTAANRNCACADGAYAGGGCARRQKYAPLPTRS